MKDVSNMKSDTYDPDINLCARQVVSHKKKKKWKPDIWVLLSSAKYK